jgi:hypothetical protein
MLIKFLQGVASSNWSYAPGQIVEMTDEDGVKWADGYRAIECDKDGNEITSNPVIEDKKRKKTEA